MEKKGGIETSEIWDRLVKLSKRTGKSLHQAAAATGISSGTIDGWKKSFPNVNSLAKIVNFYETSLDYLVFGKTHDQALLNLDDQEYSLLAGFRVLDDRDKEDILGNIRQKIENVKKGANSSSSSEANA